MQYENIAFKKENNISNNRTDTEGTTKSGKQNDTATLQNTVSTGKGTTKNETDKGVEEKITKTKYEQAKGIIDEYI